MNEQQFQQLLALYGDCQDEEHAFVQDFERRITYLLKQFRREFPVKQTIRWTIEYGNNKTHTFHINVKPVSSMNRD